MSAPLASLTTIPNGEAGTIATLKKMRQLIRAGKKNPEVRQLAVSIVSHLPSKAYFKEVEALFNWTHGNVRYTRDIRNVETLHTPEQIIRQRSGDCDDMTVLICALLESIGHPTRIVAVAFGSRQFSHVLAQTKIGARWVSLDCTENVPVGWFPPHVTRTAIINN